MYLRKLVVIPVVALLFGVFAPAASAWMADACISFGGHTLYQSGSAECDTTEGHNLAVALGANTWANASNGEDNVSLAVGEDSQADTDEGNRNKAVSIHSGLAEATHGNDNTAIAIYSAGNNGDEAARSGDGDHNTAVALHDSVATAHGPSDEDRGHNNLSIAVYGSYADTFNGNNNTAIAMHDGSAIAKDGDDNEAVALHDSEARAQGGNENAAFAAYDSIACAGTGESCPALCSGSGGTTVQCPEPIEEPDGNTAIALHDSQAYAGGQGDYDWNTAVAIWECVAEAIYSSSQTDFCGPHHDDVNP